MLRHVREARHLALTMLRTFGENGVHRLATKAPTHLSMSFFPMQFALHRFAHVVVWLTCAGCGVWPHFREGSPRLLHHPVRQ